MAMTKQDVRDFISNKYQKRYSEIHEEANKRINEQIEPLIDKLYDHQLLYTLNITASRVIDMMNEALQTYREELSSDTFYFQRVISDVRTYGVKLGEKLRQCVRHKVKSYIRDPHKGALTLEDCKGSEELYQTALKLAEELAPTFKKLTDLTQLHRELMNAIDNEPSGKHAYKAMLAAGVDMSEFEEEQKQKGNLPMVVNLSVDVCLLNKTC